MQKNNANCYLVALFITSVMHLFDNYNYFNMLIINPDFT